MTFDKEVEWITRRQCTHRRLHKRSKQKENDIGNINEKKCEEANEGETTKENNDLNERSGTTQDVYDSHARKSYDWAINDQFTLRQGEHRASVCVYATLQK